LLGGDSIDNKIGQFMKWQRRLHCALEEMKMIGHGKRLLSAAATKPAIAGKR
jgi:hypothetical protein